MDIVLLRAKQPISPLKYDQARKIFNHPAKNTLHWIFYCLFVNEGQPIIDHLVSLPKGRKGYFHVKEREQFEEIRLHGLKALEYFDVPFLCKIIECTCNLEGERKGEIEKETRSKIKIKIDKMRNNRHLFAHDRKEVVNLSPEELDNLIADFIEDVDFLIVKSGELAGKTDNEIELELEERLSDILSKWEFESDCSDSNNNAEEILEDVMETESGITNFS